MLEQNRKNWISPLLWWRYHNQINFENITTLRPRRIKAIFKNATHLHKNAYLHYVLAQWFHYYVLETNAFYEQFQKLIRRTNLLLTSVEKHQLQEFALKIKIKKTELKNLKILLKVQQPERIQDSLTAVTWQKTKPKGAKKYVGKLILTNQRLILWNSQLQQIKATLRPQSYEIKARYVIFTDSDQEEIILQAQQQVRLNNTIETNY